MYMVIDTSEVMYQLNLYNSESLPYLTDNFVGRKEDIKNVTGYLDFTNSVVQVVHIVGPPGFGKSTLSIKIGHYYLRKGVKIYYIDLKDVCDVDTFVEKMLVNVIGSADKKLTLNRLKKWVHNQYSQTLIVLDNCDCIFENESTEFFEVLKTLQTSSKVLVVKYLLTSKKWVANVHKFKLHAIYNLSTQAAHQLLEKLMPTLSLKERVVIAELTGNVPLAIEVVGAILSFPEAPTPERVIQDLKEYLIPTLSPEHINKRSRVDVSIKLAYQYLSPQLQVSACTLSYFPGSFDGKSLFGISNNDSHDNVELLLQAQLLVERSLLQYSRHRNRYHFHSLIQQFLRDRENTEYLYCFYCSFQYYYAKQLSSILKSIESKKDYRTGLAMLEDDKHNFRHMFSLFSATKHTHCTMFAIREALAALNREVLELRFSASEIKDFVGHILDSLDSYSEDEVDGELFFFETYVELLLYAARQEKKENNDTQSAVRILAPRAEKVDKEYKKQRGYVTTYVNFYTTLATYYTEIEQEKKSSQCHMHALKTVNNESDHCYPDCDHYMIATAYENIGSVENAMYIRELALKDINVPLNSLKRFEVMLLLYYYYLDAVSGNNASRAEQLSKELVEMSSVIITANDSDISNDLFYNAIEFFRLKDREKHALQLQTKLMLTLMQDRKRSGDFRIMSKEVSISFRKKCFTVTIEFGQTEYRRLYGLKAADKEAKHERLYHDALVEAAFWVGLSYYHTGNCSGAQTWLRKTMDLIHEDLEKWGNSTHHSRNARACNILFLVHDFYYSGTCIWDRIQLLRQVTNAIAFYVFRPKVEHLYEIFSNYIFKNREAQTLSEKTELATSGRICWVFSCLTFKCVQQQLRNARNNYYYTIPRDCVIWTMDFILVCFKVYVMCSCLYRLTFYVISWIIWWNNCSSFIVITISVVLFGSSFLLLHLSCWLNENQIYQGDNHT